MRNTLIAMLVGAGVILLASPNWAWAGSASVREGEHVEWVEKRTSYRFRSDPDFNKTGWHRETDTIFHNRKDDSGKEDRNHGKSKQNPHR